MHSIDSKILTALLFDFDGTLVHTEHIHYEAFTNILAEYGKQFVSYPDHLKYNTGTGTRNILRKEFARHKLSVDLEKAIERKKNLYSELIRQKGAPVTSGVLEFLKTAKEKGMKIALVSGGMRENIDVVIAESGIPKVFDAEITHENISNPKPDPESFLKALHALKVSPEKCVVFEDGINGVQSALSAGITRQFVVGRGADKQRIQLLHPNIAFIQDFSEVQIL